METILSVLAASELLFSYRHMRTSSYVGDASDFMIFSLSFPALPFPTLVHVLPLSQATRVLHASRRWTRVPPAPVTITGHATPRAPGRWGSAVAAQRASPAPRVPSWWTSVPWTPAPMGSAAAWATATGVCVSQVSWSVNKGFGPLLSAAVMSALWASRAKFSQLIS